MKKTLCIVLALVLVFSLAVPAPAADSNVVVNGTIGILGGGDPGNPGDNTYTLTMPSTVNFYVTEHSYSSSPNVWNTDLSINSTNPNTISNTNLVGAAYKVTLVSFTAAGTANATVDPLLILNLTGSLAADGVGSTDLATNAAVAVGQLYSATLNPTALGAGNDWSYGFTGTYTGTLAGTALRPTYTMVLGFAL